MWNAEVISLVAGTFLLAGIVKGVVGFGLPIVALAMLANTLGLKTAIALIHGTLRRRSSQPERCAVPLGGSLEVRFQEHQVHRPDPFPGNPTAKHMGDNGAERIRVLCQCEPRG